MSRHAGYGVVQDDHGGIGLVICNIGKAGHTGMHECGITDNGHSLFLCFRSAHFVKAVKRTYGSAHAKGHLNGRKRRNRTEGVASDISEHSALILLECKEKTSVRASRAHNRGSAGDLILHFVPRGNFFSECLCDKILREFIADGKEFFTLHFYSERFNMIFYDGIKLFHNIELVNLCRKVFYKLYGKRIYHSQLKYADRIAEHFLHILERCGRCDDTDLFSALKNLVYRCGLGILAKLRRSLFNEGMTLFGIAGHHDILCYILFICLFGNDTV